MIQHDSDHGITSLRSPLSYAAENGPSETVQLFLARGDVDVNSRDERLQSPLWYVAKNRHLEIMQLFLARVDVNVNAKDKDGQSPLSYAAENGDSEVMQLFLGQGNVDVDSKDKGLRSPLLYAAENGHSGVVQQCNCSWPGLTLMLMRRTSMGDPRSRSGMPPFRNSAQTSKGANIC
jgi:ankyrin repeat protein